MATKGRIAVHFKGQPPEKRYARLTGDITSGTPLALTDDDGLTLKQHKGKTVDMVCCDGEIGVKFGGLREGTTIQKRTFPGANVAGGGIAKWMKIKDYKVTEQSSAYMDVPA